jgi:hypothetical protein
MNDPIVYAKVVAVAARISGRDAKEIQPSTTLRELGFDWNRIMKLKRELEETYSVRTCINVYDDKQDISNIAEHAW